MDRPSSDRESKYVTRPPLLRGVYVAVWVYSWYTRQRRQHVNFEVVFFLYWSTSTRVIYWTIVVDMLVHSSINICIYVAVDCTCI